MLARMLSLIAWLCFCLLGYAQELQIRFQHFGVDDGLSQNSVYAMLQDHTGYLWIGTEDGLNRFDGYGFHTFRHIPFDPTSLPNSTVTSIVEDSENLLWIAAGQNLSLFDRQSETFTHFQPPKEMLGSRSFFISEIVLGPSHKLWLSSNLATLCFDTEKRTFQQMAPPIQELQPEKNLFTFSIHLDRDGVAWMQNQDGFFSYHLQTQTWTSYAIPKTVISIHEDLNTPQLLWLGTRDGLIRFNTKTKTADAEFLQGMSPSVNVTEMIPDPQDSDVLWLATSQRGLVRFHIGSGFYQFFSSNSKEPARGPMRNQISSLATTKDGLVLVGTYLGGFSTTQPSGNPFYSYQVPPSQQINGPSVYSLRDDGKGHFWLTLDGDRVFKINRSNGNATDYPDLPKTRVRYFHQDAKNRFWAWGIHLRLYDATTDSFRIVDNFPTDHRIMWFVGNDQDLFWYTTYTSEGYLLCNWSPQLGLIASYPFPQNITGRQRVRCMVFDSQKHLWLGLSASGLLRFNPETATFQHFRHQLENHQSLNDNNIRSMLQDPHTPDYFWVGTSGGGLNLFQLSTGIFKHFTTNDGLPNNVIYGILPDEKGNLWMSTNNGISRFNPKSKLFQNYGPQHGLQAWEFNSEAFFQGSNGELFFGGINGVTYFHPNDIQTDQRLPETLITRVEIPNKSGDPNKTLAFNLPSEFEHQHLTLKHHQNDVIIDYVGLHYTNPRGNRYRYRLKNYDPNWRYVGALRKATYTNLNPGEYQFVLQAANSNGIWQTHTASIRLRILSPWWATPLAYLVYALIFAALLTLAHTIQKRRLIRRERLKATQREEQLKRQAAEAKAEALELENRRQNEELERARELQLSMLPQHLPNLPGLEVSACMQTATEVGGDYYDFHLDSNGTLTLAIGDATGHGMAAGVVVTATKSLFHNLAGDDCLVTILQNASASIKKMGFPKLYMALSLIRIENQTVEIVGAGLPPALHYRAAENHVTTIALKGLPLGGPGQYPYQVNRVPFHSGDTLVFMTDGFPEWFNPQGQILGYEKAKEMMAEIAHQSPEAIRDHFLDVGKAWAKQHPIEDDITLMILKAT